MNILFLKRKVLSLNIWERYLRCPLPFKDEHAVERSIRRKTFSKSRGVLRLLWNSYVYHYIPTSENQRYYICPRTDRPVTLKGLDQVYRRMYREVTLFSEVTYSKKLLQKDLAKMLRRLNQVEERNATAHLTARIHLAINEIKRSEKKALRPSLSNVYST